jgi:tRNA splicing ligase
MQPESLAFCEFYLNTCSAPKQNYTLLKIAKKTTHCLKSSKNHTLLKIVKKRVALKATLAEKNNLRGQCCKNRIHPSKLGDSKTGSKDS